MPTPITYRDEKGVNLNPGEVDGNFRTLVDSIAGIASNAITQANAYTDTQVAALVGLAPATLNTLQEIADSLNQEGSAIATLTALVNQKQNITLAGLDFTVSTTIATGDSVPGAFGKLQAQLNALAGSISGNLGSKQDVAMAGIPTTLPVSVIANGQSVTENMSRLQGQLGNLSGGYVTLGSDQTIGGAKSIQNKPFTFFDTPATIDSSYTKISRSGIEVLYNTRQANLYNFRLLFAYPAGGTSASYELGGITYTQPSGSFTRQTVITLPFGSLTQNVSRQIAWPDASGTVALQEYVQAQIAAINTGGAGILSPVQDITALQSVAVDATKDKFLIHVENAGMYAFDYQSIATANETTIVTPAGGTGRWLKKIGLASSHNLLDLLQGGTTGEYYHLTNAEHTKLQALPTNYKGYFSTYAALNSQLTTGSNGDFAIVNGANSPHAYYWNATTSKWVDPLIYNHYKFPDLQGGTAPSGTGVGEYYHLTNAQLQKLVAIPNIPDTTGNQLKTVRVNAAGNGFEYAQILNLFATYFDESYSDADTAYIWTLTNGNFFIDSSAFSLLIGRKVAGAGLAYGFLFDGTADQVILSGKGIQLSKAFTDGTTGVFDSPLDDTAHYWETNMPIRTTFTQANPGANDYITKAWAVANGLTLPSNFTVTAEGLSFTSSKVNNPTRNNNQSITTGVFGADAGTGSDQRFFFGHQFIAQGVGGKQAQFNIYAKTSGGTTADSITQIDLLSDILTLTAKIETTRYEEVVRAKNTANSDRVMGLALINEGTEDDTFSLGTRQFGTSKLFVESISDTQLAFTLVGNDGITRTATLTLS